ncbi:MAG: hypothetical protein ACR2PU_00655 [Gammaproteobacteria bacterium]
MKEFYLLLTAFGASGTFIGWFLYQRSLSRMVGHIKVNHYEIWLNLNCPIGKSPPDPILNNLQVRKFIIKKEYGTYTDLFLKEIGDVVRQRLIFSVFCFICLVVGIVLFTITSI